ncbi:hypothetical protein CQW32_05420 [Pseudomonas putida]|uniref:Uncharacterized protein n=1 Tax=Aromatoleum bremense TaxID=76115 RepID=A0ABX1P0F9_9RHOO|nr:hypothetical protein [Aromatoleum bremense]PJX11656.1 hypothetical protein CQW32_05420 [Pseudomonas putida]
MRGGTHGTSSLALFSGRGCGQSETPPKANTSEANIPTVEELAVRRQPAGGGDATLTTIFRLGQRDVAVSRFELLIPAYSDLIER